MHGFEIEAKKGDASENYANQTLFTSHSNAWCVHSDDND